VLLVRIAGFARRHDVAPGGAATASHRNDMIHRERLGRVVTATVVADSLRSLSLPPLGPAQLSGSRALAADVLAIGDCEALERQ